jgi:glycosyltransferase involved in cell wall biosynthesis
VAHLRYPSARETSAALLRALAQGRPCVISALEHLADIPEDVVARVAPDAEEELLAQQIVRLGGDADERRRLGRRAAAFVREQHSPERCREGYLRAIEAALTRPPAAARPGWPAHWRHE